MESVDIKSVFVESVSSSGPAVNGPCWLMGIGLISKIAANALAGITYQGTISFVDKTSSSASGPTLFKIPVIGSNGYPVTLFTGFADNDGYVKFENGIWVEQTTESTKSSPLTGYNLIINYG